MKRFLFITILACIMPISCSENATNATIASGNSDKDNIPVTTQVMREGDTVTIAIQADSGFGIQIEAPNQLTAEGISGLQVKSSDLKFKGNPKPDKPDYYSNIEPMTVQVAGEGSLKLTGKLFYCDYSKNICLPGKINRTISIQ